jgi:LmbE family N-acetylglucosaminyl deacetylase
MIVPLTDEATWLATLANLALWQPPSSPTIVIAPHPDDEALAAGGLIASLCGRGIDVTVIAVTDGERAYGNAPDRSLAQLREREQTAALGRLGVAPDHILRLRLPDSEVAIHEAEIVRRLLPVISADTHLIAPWTGDFHPDHEACGRAAQQLAQRTGAQLSFWFFWTWHRGTPRTLQNLELRKLPLTDQQRRAKVEAIDCHGSQLQRVSGDPILPLNLLQPALRPFEVFLPA